MNTKKATLRKKRSIKETDPTTNMKNPRKRKGDLGPQIIMKITLGKYRILSITYLTMIHPPHLIFLNKL